MGPKGGCAYHTSTADDYDYSPAILKQYPSDVLYKQKDRGYTASTICSKARSQADFVR